MKSRVASAEPNGKAAKYVEMIEDYIARIEAVRVEMRRSKLEIQRLKAESKRKLEAIDAVLNEF